MQVWGILTFQKTGKETIPPELAILGIKTDSLGCSRKKYHYGSARSSSQVNGQITMKAAQVAKEINLETNFFPQRPGPLCDRDDLVEPGAISQQFGSLVPDDNHNPGLRIILPQCPDTGGGKDNISYIAQLHK